MTIIETNNAKNEAWDKFVVKASYATFAHLYGWKNVIEDVYGHPCYYFEAWDGNDLVGVLPTTFIKSRFFGKQLVSVPYMDTGGPLALHNEASQGLIEAARDIATKFGADVCLRSLDEGLCNWQRQTSKVTMYLPLNSNPNDMLKIFSSERRNRIKKAGNNGLTVHFHREDALDSFYRVFSENMRDLGSPVHNKAFIHQILAEFPDSSGIILVKEADGRIIGAGLYFRFGDVLALPWVSSLRDSFKLNPNILLYWGLIKYGCETGAKIFDFGRSTVDSGTYEYKRQWGAEPVPLYWYIHSSNNISVEALDSTSRKNQLMIELWKKLPLNLANAIGPMVRKSISL